MQRQFLISLGLPIYGLVLNKSRSYFLKRLRSHCFVFVSIRFCCIEATRPHCSVFIQKRSKKVHLCAITLLRLFEIHCLMLNLCQKPPSVWISTFEGVFETSVFVAFFCRSMRTLFQKRRFSYSFLLKNGAM